MICPACKKAVMKVVCVLGIPNGVQCPACNQFISQEAVMEMERSD